MTARRRGQTLPGKAAPVGLLYRPAPQIISAGSLCSALRLTWPCWRLRGLATHQMLRWFPLLEGNLSSRQSQSEAAVSDAKAPCFTQTATFGNNVFDV